MNNHIKHGILLTAIGIVVFVGVGAIFTKVNCGLGPKGAETYEGSLETATRQDDYSFFSHFVCTGSRLQHNR